MGEGILPSPASARCQTEGLQHYHCLISHCPGPAAHCDLLTQVPSGRERGGDQTYQRSAPPSPPSPTLECFPAAIPLAGDQPAAFTLARDFLAWYLPFDFL